MAKRSGSKTSRSDRRAGKQRAQRAREHGLPERREEARRARASTPEPGSRGDGDDRSSDAPPGRSPKKAGIPTLVKVIAGALVILLGVYILSQRREQALTDTKPAPELPSAEASASVESPTTAVPEPEPEPAPRASAALAPAAEPAPVVSVTPPLKPVVAMPLASAPARPLVPRPVVAPPAAVTVAKPPAPVAAPTPPVAAPPAPPAAPAPPPAAPKASPPPATTKPVDNPY